MSLPEEFQLIIPVPSGAPFAALGARCDDRVIHSIDYLSAECLAQSQEIRPQSELVAELERKLLDFLEKPKSVDFGDLPLCDSMLTVQERNDGAEILPDEREVRVKVRAEVCAIPYGKTRTYGKIARQRVGLSARSVGAACRDNPLAIVVPCYRVVAEDGVGGFEGNPFIRGMDPVQIKFWLLKHEENNRFD